MNDKKPLTYTMYVPKNKYGELLFNYISNSYSDLEGGIDWQNTERQGWTIVKVQVTVIE